MATRKEKLALVVSAKDKSKGVLGNIQKQIVGIGAAYMGWQAITGVLGSIVEKGQENEKVWNDVSAALKRHGHEVDDNLSKIGKFADQMQTLSGESDEVIGKMVQGFLDYGQTVEEAMDTTKVAMDLAAGAGMDLKAATDLLAKAAVGYTGTLSRYGIIIDESIPKSEKFAAAIAQINDRFGGAAAARADTFAVKISLLTERFGDFQEQLFYTFSPDLLWAINSAVDIMGDFTRAVSGAEEETENLAADMITSKANALELTTQIGELTTAFSDGKITLGEFRTALSDVGKKQDKATTGGLGLAGYIRSSFIPAQEALNKRLEEGGISLDQYNNFLADLKAQIPRSEMVDFEQVLQDVIDKQNTLAAQVVEGKRKEAEAIIKTAEASKFLQESLVKDNAQMAKSVSGLLTTITVSYETRKGLHREMTAEILEQEETIEVATLGALEVVLQAARAAYANMTSSGLQWTDKMLVAVSQMSKSGQRVFSAFANSVHRSLDNAALRIVGSLDFLQTESTGVFKNMAADFSRFFLEEVSRQIAARVALWLIELALFDKPDNDRMAVRIGQDYMKYFAKGVDSIMPSFQTGFIGALAMTPTMAPAMSGGYQGGGGGNTINVNFYGPITNREYVESEIMPVIESVVRGGMSAISIENDHLTGGPDVGVL